MTRGTKEFALIALLPVTLAGCGGSFSLDNPFKKDPVRVETVYVADQDLNIAVVRLSNYPTGWEAGTTTVVTPQLGALSGTTPTNLNQTLEDGTAGKPFNDSTLFWNYQRSANEAYLDPSAWVKSGSGQAYNLTWGSPDVNGPAFALRHDSADNFRYQVTAPETVWTKQLTGSVTSEGPKLLSPGFDARSAWSRGWTGAGTRVLVFDGASGDSGDFELDNHGIIVSRIVSQYAPGATVLYKDTDNGEVFLPSAPRRLDGTASGLTGSNRVHAVNLSLNYPLPILNSTLLSILKGQTGFTYAGVDLTDSTIAVAAGNDSASLTSVTELPNVLVNDPATLSRTIVVGAIAVNANNGSRDRAGYSNTPGTNATMQNRFVLAPGDASWADGFFAIDGTQVSASTTQGTSFAAPRVAAYAAIVRQKFPNITGEQAASILLETATTERLGCFPNCNAAQYGRGEVSLTRSLAPVGRLR